MAFFAARRSPLAILLRMWACMRASVCVWCVLNVLLRRHYIFDEQKSKWIRLTFRNGGKKENRQQQKPRSNSSPLEKSALLCFQRWTTSQLTLVRVPSPAQQQSLESLFTCFEISFPIARVGVAQKSERIRPQRTKKKKRHRNGKKLFHFFACARECASAHAEACISLRVGVPTDATLRKIEILYSFRPWNFNALSYRFCFCGLPKSFVHEMHNVITACQLCLHSPCMNHTTLSRRMPCTWILIFSYGVRSELYSRRKSEIVRRFIEEFSLSLSRF